MCRRKSLDISERKVGAYESWKEYRKAVLHV